MSFYKKLNFWKEKRPLEDSGVIFIKIPITLQKVHFATKVRTLFIMVGLLYNHALTLFSI